MEVYAVKQEEIDDFRLKSLIPYLSEKRKDKISRFLRQEDIYHSIIGEILVRKLVCEKLDLKNNQIIFENNNYGKPFLKGYDNLYFNISHSRRWVVCAISEREVGVDIEEVKAIDLNIAKRFFSKKEYEELMTKNNQLSYFYNLWTLKESYIKAVGMGLSIPLNQFTIIDRDKNIFLEDQNRSGLYTFKKYKIDRDYKMASCVKGKLQEDELIISSVNEIINDFKEHI
ncbi:hypothetical protein U472_04335 [Orenia metallireducens]|uniref:Uncharacterized protein n=1 Tax=Orenia metallireducens TaxID=1413210 RepID=A0A1C0ABX4_9FIRM|nr:hypothetical protein U472_04335 [Orenia metallireducens]